MSKKARLKYINQSIWLVDGHKTIRSQTFIEKLLASPKYIFKDDSQENISQDIVSS